MRYRKLDANGDYMFGRGQNDFWINQPEAVAQWVLTRLMLWQGQWFYDLTEGTAWATEVLGVRTQSTRDVVVRDRVRDTIGVTDIANYASLVNPNTRSFAVAMTLDTAFGAQPLAVSPLPATIPPLPPTPIGGGGAALLALRGGVAPLTGTTMEPANLTLPGPQQIAGFEVTTVDGGRF